MIFDTHAHYDDEAFEEDREALLESLKDGGIGAVMNVAASLESCRTTLLLAGHYDWMYLILSLFLRLRWERSVKCRSIIWLAYWMAILLRMEVSI